MPGGSGFGRVNDMNAVTKTEGGAEPVAIDHEVKTPAAAPQPAKKPRRRGRRMFLMFIVPLLLVVGGVYFWLSGGRYETTDNAYLHQPKVSIAAEASGRVVEVDFDENSHVKKDDVLFVIDPQPYKIALAQANAALEQARIQVQQLRAAYQQAVTQEQSAANEVAYQQRELDRQKKLSGKGVTTASALDTAERDLEKAQDAHAAAKDAVNSALAALGGDPDVGVDDHPSVLAAKAARDKAELALSQTTVRAPADGVIAQADSFRVGQFVGAGTPLFSLVEAGDEWVAANFKETQLTHLTVGQEAEVTFDTYPDQPLKGTIESIGAGTGSEFSLLPAQNATGNWVKVTQRIPVRIKLASAGNLPLRTGMSAEVSVDTGRSRSLAGLFDIGGRRHARPEVGRRSSPPPFDGACWRRRHHWTMGRSRHRTGGRVTAGNV